MDKDSYELKTWTRSKHWLNVPLVPSLMFKILTEYSVYQNCCKCSSRFITNVDLQNLMAWFDEMKLTFGLTNIDRMIFWYHTFMSTIINNLKIGSMCHLLRLIAIYTIVMAILCRRSRLNQYLWYASLVFPHVFKGNMTSTNIDKLVFRWSSLMYKHSDVYVSVFFYLLRLIKIVG